MSESVYVGMLNMYAFLSSVLYVCLYVCGIYSDYNIHSIIMAMGLLLANIFICSYSGVP